MILSGVDNSVLLLSQPSLSKYYPVGQTTYDNQITEAMRQIVRELKKNRKNLKKFCTPKELQSLITIDSNTNSDLVADDIDRMLFRVIVSTFNADASFLLQGTNDDGTNYTNIGELQFTETGTQILVFTDTYSKYRIVATATDSTQYKADLIESSFYHAHLFLSLSLAYKTMIKTEGDRFGYLATMYEQKYLDEMNTMIATYDDDSSGIIDNDETSKVSSVGFLR